jgi:tetratricopeptide (TPR) repeat protein
VRDIAPPRVTDIGALASTILGKRLGVGECEAARAKLRSDAWALEAMVDVGFCDAIAGKLDEADGVFMRLLAYTPDNYEALVGRGLIASKRGVRADARNFFQQALNALPPMAESDRIEAAMKTL